MPTYDYKCDACGNAWEQFQSMTAAPTKRCPKCGKNKARRLIGTGAGLIFKGSGFYITDYRDAGYKDQAKAETGGDTTTASTDGKAAGDTKPATDAAAAKRESKPAKAESKPAKPSASKGSSSRKPD